MASDDKRLIVVKRIKKVAGGHHGGALENWPMPISLLQ